MAKYDLTLLKQSNNIVDVAREFGHDVIRNRMRCLRAQNHQNNDQHPSMILKPDSNSYWCPVCHVSGDVIDFVIEDRDLRFYDAVCYLAQRSGLSPGSETGTERFDKNHSVAYRRPDPSEFLEVYAYFFELCSEPTEDALNWLQVRGVSRETVALFKVKCVRKQREVLESLLQRFPDEVLRGAGLVTSGGNAIWRRHKLVWTYFREEKPIYFQCRSLDTNARPKEMCISAPVPCPFNIDILKKAPEQVFVCEGVLDTLTLADRGLPAIGVPGVNGFKDSWMELFRGTTVRVAFDSDLPGQSKAVELVHKFRGAGIEASRVHLPQGYDVNRFFDTARQFGL